MKKSLFIVVLMTIAFGTYAQGIDPSQVSLNPSDRTKPYLGKELVDTLGTCMAVKAELESIAEQGASAFDTNGRKSFIRSRENEIEAETDRLAEDFVPDIKEQALAESENEFQRLLVAVQDMAENSNSLFQYYSQLGESKELQQYISTFMEKYAGKLSFNLSGSPSLKKMSKALQKDLQKDKATAMGHLTAILQNKAIKAKKNELQSQAETNALRSYIGEVMKRMPPFDSPECYAYIHGYGNTHVEYDYHIHRITREYFRDREVFKTDKKKIITWKNPNYFKEDDSWEWLSEGINDSRTGNRKDEWKEEVTHFPKEDRFFVNSNHSEYKVRRLVVNTQCGTEVYAAFKDDELEGVSNDYSIARSYIDRELEQILCFYELEHNKHNINAQPAYVKDCIRYELVTFRHSNDSYSWNNSWDYTKSHKNETLEMSEQYIKQLHLDHKVLGEGSYFYKNISKFASHRTERVDGLTFRHYIGTDEQIVILQKFVYGNYCWKLFPFSKVTTFNSKDYVVNKDVYKPENKVLTCYYVVEKYE